MALEHITRGHIGAPDGLLIAARLPPEIPVEPLSALAATLGRELELRGPQIRRGTFLIAQFATTSGIAALGSTPVACWVVPAPTGTSPGRFGAAVGTVYRAWAG